ncbi:MAG TPA: hypothetical protein VJ180_09945 [Pyrinomonadaceae bacterium]|nr:hypothetical protein [Pyrinomonadaceae bacterium]
MPQSEYDPGFAAFGGGTSSTLLHPVVLVAMIVAIALMLLLPRKYVIVPVLLALILIPAGQHLYIAGVHVYVHRILILGGWMRLLWTKLSSPGSLLPGGFNTLDKVFATWAICRCLAVIVRYSHMAAVVNQVGFLWDFVLGYFLIRALIRDDDDIQRALKTLSLVALVVAVGMVIEHITLQNMFGRLGGIRSLPEVRNGRIRAQGVFRHALLAGCFGATMFPLFLWLWKRGRSHLAAIIGVASSIVIVYTASTSTPLLTLFAAIFAICCWPLRKHLSPVRWAFVMVIFSLHLVMKAPVWFLIARIDLVGGSTGYHRAMLIDQFIKRFGEWWLIGTSNNQNWGFDMWDTANQFVAEGQVGGLFVFACFIAIFTICFLRIGNARKVAEGDHKKEWMFWLFGAALFAQVMAYFGVSYFDQMRFVWFTMLAMISATTASLLQANALVGPGVNMDVPGARLGYALATASPGTRVGCSRVLLPPADRR